MPHHNKPSQGNTPVHLRAEDKNRLDDLCNRAYGFVTQADLKPAFDDAEYELSREVTKQAGDFYGALSDSARELVIGSKGARRTPQLPRVNRLLEAVMFLKEPKAHSRERSTTVTQNTLCPALIPVRKDIRDARVLFAALMRTETHTVRGSTKLVKDEANRNVQVQPTGQMHFKTRVDALQLGLGDKESERIIYPKELLGEWFTGCFSEGELARYYGIGVTHDDHEAAARHALGELWRHHLAWQELSEAVDQQMSTLASKTRGRITLLGETGKSSGPQYVTLGHNHRYNVDTNTPIGSPSILEQYQVTIGDISSGWDAERLRKEISNGCNQLVQLALRQPPLFDSLPARTIR